MRRVLSRLAIACLLAGSGPVSAQPAPPEALVVHRLDGPVQLDGIPDEPAWRVVQPLPVVMQVPAFGGPPSERTEILLAYDDEHLYVAARCYDSDPAAIQATTLERDDSDASSDAFGVVLDTFDDNENALGFVTTPSGSRYDFTVAGDAQRGSGDPSWNTRWDVATARTGEGWFAELRIPFSSLRFQDRGGRVVMGLIAFRWIARRDERVLFPAIGNHWGTYGHLKPSQAHPIVLVGPRPRRPLYVTPYALGGLGQRYHLDGAGQRYRRDDDGVREVGFDAKYGLTPNLTVDLTVNTDFAQVEADDQEINLTRYPLFFPEKRLFFLERASNFGFPFYGSNTLFHSRRIGIQEGRRVPLYGGARLVGRVGRWDVGVLGMQSQELDETPSETFTVARLRRQVLNPFSYAGGIVTSRAGTDGSYNTAYGVDAVLRVFGDDYLKLNWAQTFDDDTGRDPLSCRRSKLRAHWERYRYTGFAYGLNVSRSGADYDPGLGFEQYHDRTSYIHFLRYGWDGAPSSMFLNHRVYEDVWLHVRNGDGEVESRLTHLGWTGATRSGFWGHFALTHDLEDVREALALPEGVTVPPARYGFFSLIGKVVTPGGRLLSAEIDAYAGAFYDGRRLSLAVDASRSVSSHLELGGTYQIEDVDFADRDQAFTAHVGRLRLLAMLDARTSVAAFVQYSSAADRATANVRFRYNPSEGTDVYLVYDEGFNADRARLDPSLPRTSERTVLLKASLGLAWAR